ncbi:acyl-CoA N-acyltransferase [Lyophyllum atratum]|nr:acyl-CoA N-acyltransferase [Lyophyllum atratum]
MTKTLFNLESYICYIFIVIGLALFTLSPKHRALGAVLMVGITSLFLRNRRMMSRWFIDYCLNALREDLANIATYYGLEPTSPSREEFAASGPSAFWVVECVSRDGRGTEIVGCIGLDCQKKDGIIRGELRRMAVSPHYRGMGIAGLLVKTLIAHAKKNRLPTVWLGTTEFQRPAIDMYKKHGWVQAREYVRVRFGLIKFAVLNFRLDLIPT